MTTLDLTDLCDSASCGHETDVRHERGAGVYCAECAARRVRLSFDPAAEEAEQAATRQAQRKAHAQC